MSCYIPACKGHSSNPTASPPSLALCPLCLPLQLPQLLIKVPTPSLDAGLPTQWQFTNGSISSLRFKDIQQVIAAVFPAQLPLNVGNFKGVVETGASVTEAP
jgi:hypothetical protein